MRFDGRNVATTEPNQAADESTMRAIVQDRYGTAEVLRPARIPRPVIADHEVLIRVHAAGMDRGTWHLMTGTPYLMRVMGFGFRGPKNRVPGIDVAGTVVAVGPAVTRFAVGDEVFGMSRGSFAEYAAAREDKLAHKPTNATFKQAAVAGISGGTALQALAAGRVQAGDRVLLTGASGGVGSFAVQLAKAFGAEVTGVCSTDKLDLITSLGAPLIGQRLTGLAAKERASDLEILARHITAGTVTPSIDRTYPLELVPEALRHLEAGSVRGKIAITT